MKNIRDYAGFVFIILLVAAAVAAVFGVTFLISGTAGATPIGTSYSQTYDEFYVTDRGFTSLTVQRYTDGALSVTGEKLAGEAVVVSIEMSIDGGPFSRVEDAAGQETLYADESRLFALYVTPPAGAHDVAYSVTLTDSIGEDSSWLVSLHAPEPTRSSV